MGRTKTDFKFSVKKNIKEGICRIIEDRKSCQCKIHARGVCSRHHTYFLRWKILKKYAAKHLYTYANECEYKVNKKQKPGKCQLIENNKKCKNSTHARKLCKNHWLKLSRHGLLSKYGGPSQKEPRTYKIRRPIVKGKCRVEVNGKPCKINSLTRGLCSKHYLRFLREGLLDKFGKKSTA